MLCRLLSLFIKSMSELDNISINSHIICIAIYNAFTNSYIVLHVVFLLSFDTLCRLYS